MSRQPRRPSEADGRVCFTAPRCDVGFDEILDFFDPPVSIGFDVQPTAALEAFYAKGLSKSVSYADMSAAEHANSFTVAKMADMDMLADVKTSLEKALESGMPFKQWANEITPLLQAKGWLGDGTKTPWRLETVFRTNMQSAYAVGEWQQIRAQEEVAPFLMYDAIDDFRTRPEHAALDGEIHPVSSSFWKHYHPPNGYNCRCSVIQMSQDELEELGLEVSPAKPIQTYNWTNPKTGKVEKVAVGTDPGFDFNPGELRYQELQKIAGQKANAMGQAEARAALAGLVKTQKEAAEVSGVIAAATRQAFKLTNASKAAERGAIHALNQAIDNKTPYLAKAIQQVKALPESAEMSPTQILQTAKEKALKAEQSAMLYHYKQAVTKGNVPNAKQQAAFDALPEEAQHAITDQLNATKAAVKAENDALTEIASLTSNPASLPAKTLAKMQTAGVPAVKVLEDLKASVSAQKAKQASGQALAGLKKAILAGKIPTPAQKAAFQALSDADQAKLLAETAAEKITKMAQAEAAKPSAPPPPQAAIPTQTNVAELDLDPDDLVQTGPQAGSNPGGEFTDTTTGAKWYLKYPDNVEAMRNEALANKLYQLAGVEVPDVRLITYKGKPAIASRIVDGLRVDQSALSKGRVPGVQEHFGIDAWLSNWDVIGPDFANTKLNALGRGVRIDPGGALRFRAQGGGKGAAFGNEVLDLDTMRNASQNPHSAAVFKYATKADIEDSVRRVLDIPEEKIRKMVDEFGPLDAKERQKLLATLLARREDLAKKYPNARPKAPEKQPDARVTASEQKLIEDSRANGATIPTDSDVIEDHHVVITTLKDANGKPKTRMTMKLRPQAGQKLQSTMPSTMQTAPEIADLSPVKTQALEFFKGVGALANKAEPLRDKDIARAGALLQQLKATKIKITSSGTLAANASEAVRAVTQIESMEKAVLAWTKTAKPGLPAKAFEKFDLSALPDRIMGEVPKPESGALPWKTHKEFSYNLSEISRGHIKETARANNLPGVGEVREVGVNGERVRYVPYGKGNSLTSEGYLQIDLDGVGIEVTRKGFAVIEELKIPTKRPSELDRLELYLERIASIRTLRNSKLAEDLTGIRRIEDQAQRTEFMLGRLNADAGFDMRTSPNWNPNGTTEAFGHGRTVMMRPDLKPEDMAKFEKDYLIYHNPTGLGMSSGDVWGPLRRILDAGGSFASQMDRVRRGVRSTGTSIEEDHRTGGGSYIFTRLVKRKNLTARQGGIYWKAKKVARLDAFSYDHDAFGNVSRAKQESSRAKDIDGLIKNANSHGNETNFRDSLSVFDDIEKIVLEDRTAYEEALKWFRTNGYNTWPDGRALEDVLDFSGRK